MVGWVLPISSIRALEGDRRGRLDIARCAVGVRERESIAGAREDGRFGIDHDTSLLGPAQHPWKKT